MSEIDRTVVESLKNAVGPSGWLQDEADIAPYLVDQRGLYRGRTPIVLRPADTAQVAAIVRICAEANVGVVPQGGNTGYVGGAVADPKGDQILVSLSRMRRIRDLDPTGYTITVEAGCVLAEVQQAAAEAERLFPLGLAAEGSCQIGGNLSTNAGGIAVLRYGNARDLVLGLEVVLPDGQVWNGLRGLRKDNTGYDLKQIFLGAEGTLGIITAAVLELQPRPTQRCTSLLAVASVPASLSLLSRLRSQAGDILTSFEYMRRTCIDLVLAHVQGTSDPLQGDYEHYVLVEFASAGAQGPLDALAESVLGQSLDAGETLDAVVAANTVQAQTLWSVRENIPEAQKHAGGCIKHDISVPLSRIPEFLDKAATIARERISGVRIAPFGHLGDGNIHFNLTQPEGGDARSFLALSAEVTPAIHDLAVSLGGSFSAEHGIGLLKKEELKRYRPGVELSLMRSIKRALDPRGIMNPGKVI